MKKVYINSIASISAQKTFDNTRFLEEICSYAETVLPVVSPNYKDYILPAAARRMARGIKMGVVASKLALEEAELENVDAIIIGTGMGCVRDSEKFVSAIIDNDEQYLTPTSFIQSTHNTVGGQIALGIGCKGYNFTYVHSSNSFESSLLDAKLMLQNDEANTILIGGVDELGAHTTELHKVVNHVKKNIENSLDILKSNTEGAVFGEGANFFTLGNEKKSSTYAEVIGIKMYNTLKSSISDLAKQFITSQKIAIAHIDLVILGNNGDVTFDGNYNELSSELFANTQQVYYKHLCGEFNTASSFGFWLASKILKNQHLPKVTKLNNINDSSFKYVLLYNQYRGKNHSFTLLRKC
ncbi:MAG: 3-oxoacyl-ACP synthase [Kordia sp.]|nr:MAG: 3-oxoacyl-ACP synthase [Kordia sp.]